ncbi:hypothetical protein THAOC_19882 [Thalassiosira oceanica]|uniref:Uncharacterized protein n=1 Tax=Thalassiosira oceanica TaxID=159749 RepID=K0SMZ6_THAOC|nr:hypothetical protein THAOC_19882 [Thalassiosira oceanica]|eukprot:EJK59847.1 hypothetical protein THAOC_19882 [Thalassiosira oceanica]
MQLDGDLKWKASAGAIPLSSRVHKNVESIGAFKTYMITNLTSITSQFHGSSLKLRNLVHRCFKHKTQENMNN